MECSVRISHKKLCLHHILKLAGSCRRIAEALTEEDLALAFFCEGAEKIFLQLSRRNSYERGRGALSFTGILLKSCPKCTFFMPLLGIHETRDALY